MKIFKILRSIASGWIKVHTGQWAEDVLVRKLVGHIKNGFYVDLGAYHPFIHSNTAGLWLKGWSGINVDANPHSIRLFEQIRNADINIWAAVLPTQQIRENREVMLCIPDVPDDKHGISARGSCQSGIVTSRGMTKTIAVPAISVAEILERSHRNKIDYLNIDLEGMDDAILKEFDFERYNPYVVSIEDYANNINELITSNITSHMLNKDYSLIARAGPTSIFIKNQ
ncbi:MAG: FkbM family methyltransferase [Chloroflexi bacterium]|nr:FkbM family methyltransferase [Chloroflexota bacterium]